MVCTAHRAREGGALKMPTLTLPVTEHGVCIPSATAELLGCPRGGWVEVEVRALPSPEELRNKALRYAARRLGEAVFTDAPVWTGDGWRLPLRVRHHAATFGQVFISRDGEIDESRTTSRAELLEALDAQSPDHAPTA